MLQYRLSVLVEAPMTSRTVSSSVKVRAKSGFYMTTIAIIYQFRQSFRRLYYVLRRNLSRRNRVTKGDCAGHSRAPGTSGHICRNGWNESKGRPGARQSDPQDRCPAITVPARWDSPPAARWVGWRCAAAERVAWRVRATHLVSATEIYKNLSSLSAGSQPTGRTVGVAGWGSLSRFRPKTGYRFSVEDSIYVALAYRGRGVGKLLQPPHIEALRSNSVKWPTSARSDINSAGGRMRSL
jgi:GNAT superfamily N-acetyltransferase